MVARLGYVLYWAGCGLALLLLAFAVLAGLNRGDGFVVVMLVVLAVVVWLIGRACRYVLAGT